MKSVFAANVGAMVALHGLAVSDRPGRRSDGERRGWERTSRQLTDSDNARIQRAEQKRRRKMAKNAGKP